MGSGSLKNWAVRIVAIARGCRPRGLWPPGVRVPHRPLRLRYKTYMQKYAFLDRDGTFLWEPERPKSVDPRETFPLQSMEQFKFMDGAMDGIQKLVDNGYKLVMVTNQTFLGTPKHPKEMFDKVMSKIDEELEKYGIGFEFKMVCPHGPDEGCDCRKPKIGGLKDFLENKSGEIDL